MSTTKLTLQLLWSKGCVECWIWQRAPQEATVIQVVLTNETELSLNLLHTLIWVLVNSRCNQVENQEEPSRSHSCTTHRPKGWIVFLNGHSAKQHSKFVIHISGRKD